MHLLIPTFPQQRQNMDKVRSMLMLFIVIQIKRAMNNVLAFIPSIPLRNTSIIAGYVRLVIREFFDDDHIPENSKYYVPELPCKWLEYEHGKQQTVANKFRTRLVLGVLFQTQH